MRLKYTFIFSLIFSFALLFVAENCCAQSNNKKTHLKKKLNITGIWRGYFYQKDKVYDPIKGTFVYDKYKYEIQINNLPTNNLEGVTYSYLNTTFYGKTSLQGIFTTSTNNVIIKENKMLELKMTSDGDAYLMTCYLSYSKEGDKEYLKGEYSSVNMNSKKSACGDGIVFLEKVPTTDFTKEDFLLKKVTTPTTKNITKNNFSKPKSTASLNKENKTNTSLPKLKYKPGAEDALVKKEVKPTELKKDTATTIASTEIKNESLATNKKITLKKNTELPKELTERKNNYVKTFYVGEGDIKIELYDNGKIDNDTVSVYHNGTPIILHARLSTKPITATIHVSAENPIHEIIMVADNLGEIPPNTSLMKVTVGGKTYQALITSDLQENAKVIFEYNPTKENLNNKK